MIEIKEEDYLLYFFNELALEYTPPKLNPSQLVTRVARVCKVKFVNQKIFSSI